MSKIQEVLICYINEIISINELNLFSITSKIKKTIIQQIIEIAKIKPLNLIFLFRIISPTD
jgi:hypothetical protein